MKKKGRKTKLKSLLDQELVEEFLREHGYDDSDAQKTASRLVDQTFAKFVKRKGDLKDFSKPSKFLTGFPKTLLSLLDQNEWVIMTITLSQKVISSDGSTIKLLLALEEGHELECVVLKHTKRRTICVSSQVGCKMGCTFCATGALGIEYNLYAGEILQQLVWANTYLKKEENSTKEICFTNVVFMGMGEPLNNYSSVVQAIKSLISVKRFSLSPAKVCLSTVGVVSKMKCIHADLPGVSLALSLHAPSQELRQKIIPTASAYPLRRIMDAVYYHLQHNGGMPIMIEYILLAGVNDLEEIANELAALLQPIKNRVIVNLIPYNPVFNPKGLHKGLAKSFKAPSKNAAMAFKNTIQKVHGIFCTIRTEMGQDVNGACGELACVSNRKNDSLDIEDLFADSRKKEKLERTVHNKTRNSTSLRSSSAVLVFLSFSLAFSIIGICIGKFRGQNWKHQTTTY